MARHRKAEGLEEDEPELNISSLIDICFLLLIYFLVTTTIEKKEQDLQLALPSSSGGQPNDEIQPMFIRTDRTGAIFLNSGAAQETLDTDTGSRELPMLYQRLQTYVLAARTTSSKPLVQLYVEGDSKNQRVVDVLNALAKQQIDQVTFTDLIDFE